MVTFNFFIQYCHTGQAVCYGKCCAYLFIVTYYIKRSVQKLVNLFAIRLDEAEEFKLKVQYPSLPQKEAWTSLV